MEECTQVDNYRTWLQAEFSRRKSKHPSYSLRAFAKKVGTSPASMSQILSGKRPLSLKSADRIANRLGLNPETKRQLLWTVMMSQLEVISAAENGSVYSITGGVNENP